MIKCQYAKNAIFSTFFSIQRSQLYWIRARVEYIEYIFLDF